MATHRLPFEQISIERVKYVFGDAGQQMSLMDVCGFFLCRRGVAEVRQNDRIFHMQAGDMYLYAPSTYVKVISHSGDIEGIAVKCQLHFVLPLMERVATAHDFLQLRECPCISLDVQQLESLEKMLLFLQMKLNRLSALSPESGQFQIMKSLVFSLAEGIFHELLFDFVSNHPTEAKKQDVRDRIFQAFLISLFRNYKKEREVSFYAEEQHLSPRYFSSIIKEKSGHSALHWIILMVISSIREVLRNSDLSMKEIATEFHFPSQSFFGKYFKQYVGVSPKEYRRQYYERGASEGFADSQMS